MPEATNNHRGKRATAVSQTHVQATEARGKPTWVEKMLQEHHLTSAPSAVRVSMSTAV